MQITTEADVIACYISLSLADVIANVFVVDVMTTYNTEADVFTCYITLLLADVIAKHMWWMLCPYIVT